MIVNKNEIKRDCLLVYFAVLANQSKIKRKRKERLIVELARELIKTMEQWWWYWEESWRLKETCSHSSSNERSSANAGMKNSQGVHNQTERKFLKEYFRRTRKFLETKLDSRNLNNGLYPRKILGTILKVYKGRFSTMDREQENSWRCI